MSNDTLSPERSNPFASLFDEIQPGQFKDKATSKPLESSSKVKQQVAHEAAAEEGYSRSVSSISEKPQKKATKAPKKPEMIQFSVRAKSDVIEQFRALLETQEPNWSLGYGLERAVKALQTELGKKG